MFFFLFITLLGCSDLMIPQVILMIISVISKESSLEFQLKNEIIDLKRQLQTVSMVDQFPAYAKLQRKINALTTQYKDKASERKTGLLKMKFVLQVVLKAFIILCCLWIVWNHRSSPVTVMSRDLMWPISPILAFPSCQPGEISAVMWMMFVKTGSGRFLKIFTHTRNSDSSQRSSVDGM